MSAQVVTAVRRNINCYRNILTTGPTQHPSRTHRRALKWSRDVRFSPVKENVNLNRVKSIIIFSAMKKRKRKSPEMEIVLQSSSSCEVESMDSASFQLEQSNP